MAAKQPKDQLSTIQTLAERVHSNVFNLSLEIGRLQQRETLIAKALTDSMTIKNGEMWTGLDSIVLPITPELLALLPSKTPTEGA